MRSPDGEYPPEAYADNGVLWWDLEVHPGKKLKYGAERKIAAYLAFNLEVGDTFTMKDLRDRVGRESVPNSQEHLNRRLRKLREEGWILLSNKDDKSLNIGVYRIEQIGWHPGEGERPKADSISKSMERAVFERDGYRCAICGIGRGEPYPGDPDTRAVITVGHRQARMYQGSTDDIENLETQCKIHNETVRADVLPESVDEVLVDLRKLRKSELERLETWLGQGYRSRDRLDQIHDRIRTLSPAERSQVFTEVRKRLGRV